jgi:uncharacterized YccA/Bax inhibitor family protein
MFERSAAEASSGVMTIQGTITKVLILGTLAFASAGWVWNVLISTRSQAAVMPWLYGGLAGGIVFALVTIFKPNVSNITAPLYAISEGLFLGAISSFLELAFPGIVLQAVGLTFGVLFVMAMLYKFRIIEATPRFQRIMYGAIGAIFLLYLSSFLLRLFGVPVPFIHQMGWLGIGLSLLISGVAAFSLILDFDFIEESAELGAPKYMEWYGAFALMLTLVWLYLELLRLLAIFSSD